MSLDLNPLQVALVALLPKSGAPVTVAELARCAAVTPDTVVSALLPTYMAFMVDFDLKTDSYWLMRDSTSPHATTDCTKGQHHV